MTPKSSIRYTRRTTVGIAAMLAGLVHTTRAATSRQSTSSPNLYDLTGENVSIAYATTSINGKPNFTYTEGATVYSVTGYASDTSDGIIVNGGNPGEPLPLGSLVTITVDAAPDAWVRTLSLILPEIHLSAQSETFATFAIMTTHHTSIGGPTLVDGPLQTYDTIALTGTAQTVDF